MGFRDLFRKKPVLDPRIAEKKQELEQILIKALEDGRYSFFEFDRIKEIIVKCEKLNNYEKFEYFYNLAKEWDDNCKLTRGTGEYLNELMKDEFNVPGIHRTDLGRFIKRDGIPYNASLGSIMKDGLNNYGHDLQGAVTETPSPSLTATPLVTFGDLINLVASYKGNNAVVILQFPKYAVTNDLHFRSEKEGEEFYIRKGDDCIIDPKYIVGAVIKSKEGPDEFYSKEQIISASKTK